MNPFEEKIESAEEYDLDQGNRIVNPPYITEKMAMRFFSMFWGREDVYARRGKKRIAIFSVIYGGFTIRFP